MKTKIEFSPITNKRFTMIMIAFVVLQVIMVVAISTITFDSGVAFLVIFITGVSVIFGIVKDPEINLAPWISSVLLALTGGYAFHMVWPNFLAPIIAIVVVAGMLYGFAIVMAKIPTIPEPGEFTITITEK